MLNKEMLLVAEQYVILTVSISVLSGPADVKITRVAVADGKQTVLLDESMRLGGSYHFRVDVGDALLFQTDSAHRPTLYERYGCEVIDASIDASTLLITGSPAEASLTLRRV